MNVFNKLLFWIKCYLFDHLSPKLKLILWWRIKKIYSLKDLVFLKKCNVLVEIFKGKSFIGLPAGYIGGEKNERIETETEYFEPPILIYSFKNSTIFGETGGVITCERYLVSTFYRRFRDTDDCESLYRIYPWKEKLKIDGIVGVWSCQAASYNYYHWLTDALPRLIALIECKEAWERISHIYGPKITFKAQEETLSCINISNKEYIESGDQFVKCREIIIPSRAGYENDFMNPTMPTSWACKKLKKYFLPFKSNIQYSKYIFISRLDANTRQIKDEVLLLEKLKLIGFQVLLLSKMSFFEQLAAFANAEIIVGAHGAGLTNCFFSKPNTSLIEICSCQEYLGFYRAISLVNDIKYLYYGAKWDDCNKMYEVNIDELIRYLKSIIMRV